MDPVFVDILLLCNGQTILKYRFNAAAKFIWEAPTPDYAIVVSPGVQLVKFMYKPTLEERK